VTARGVSNTTSSPAGVRCAEQWDSSWRLSCTSCTQHSPGALRLTPGPAPSRDGPKAAGEEEGGCGVAGSGCGLCCTLIQSGAPTSLSQDVSGLTGRQQHACSPGSSTHPLKDLACTELSKGRKLWQAAPGSSSTAPQAHGVSYGTSHAPTARHSPLANHCNLGSVVISFLNCAGSKLVFGLLTYKFSQLARRARCFCEWKNCIYLFAFSKSLKPYFCRSKKKAT